MGTRYLQKGHMAVWHLGPQFYKPVGLSVGILNRIKYIHYYTNIL